MKEDGNKGPYTPWELFGVECGKGWEKLYKPLFEYIEKYNSGKEKDEDKIFVLQCKEKFGTLRFYTNFATPELEDMIEEAEDKSFNVCEMCGSEEHVGHTSGDWITVCCIDCLKKIIGESFYGRHWISHSDEKEYFANCDDIDEVIKKVKNQK